MTPKSSFPLAATTRLSLHGISSHARTRCGCLESATTRNFALFQFLKCHNTLLSFFALNERFRSLSLTYVLYSCMPRHNLFQNITADVLYEETRFGPRCVTVLHAQVHGITWQLLSFNTWLYSLSIVL